MSDPYFGDVKLLLHCDGANGSTTFTDAVGICTVAASGDAKVSTDQQKFGTGSLALDGTGDYLGATPASTFALGSSNWTIEFWAYLTAYGGLGSYMVSIGDIGGYNGIVFRNSSAGVLEGGVVTVGGTAIVSGTTSSLNAWHHMALCRDGNTLRLFRNGVQLGTASITWSIGTPTYARIGGRWDGTLYTTGYIDDVRITVGTARYTANFTPPTAAFPDSAVNYQDGAFSSSGTSAFAASGSYATMVRGVLDVACSSTLAFQANMHANAKAVFQSKTIDAFKAGRIAPTAFNIRAGAKFVASAPKNGDMLVRFKGRTITRFRSAQWVW